MSGRAARRTGRVAALAAAAFSAAGACRSAVTVEDRWPSYEVAGVVRTASGAPVAGASVVVRSRRGGCGGALDSQTGPAVTDAAGRYGTAFADPLGSFSGCVEVQATPPAGRGLGSGAAARDGVALGRAGAGAQGVSIDVTLPAGGP